MKNTNVTILGSFWRVFHIKKSCVLDVDLFYGLKMTCHKTINPQRDHRDAEERNLFKQHCSRVKTIFSRLFKSGSVQARIQSVTLGGRFQQYLFVKSRENFHYCDRDEVYFTPLL